MEQERYESLRAWAWRLAVGTALIVGLVSFGRGVGFLWLMLRMLLAFVIMYGLSVGSLYLFRQGGTEAGFDVRAADGKGNLLDIVLGAETVAASDEGEDHPGVAGRAEETATENAAGAGLRGVPGQTESGLGQGPPDSAQEAQIVRRMGWKD